MSLKFKYGNTIQGKNPDAEDVVFVNASLASGEGDAKRGSIYRGDKIVGTTEADKLVTTENITVTGVTVGNLVSGNTISEGTDIMAVLKQILMKEIDVSKTNPSVTVKNTGTNAGTYEVGTEINIDLSHTYTDGKFTGQSGYSYTLAAGCAEGTTQYKKNGSVMSGNTDTHTLGEETVSYTCTTTYAASTAQPKTNFGNNSTVNIPANSCTSTNTLSYVGVYKYFMGYSTNTTVEAFNSASVRALTTKTNNITKDGTTTVVDGNAIKSNGTSIVIACPSKYKLAGAQNGLGANILANFNVSGTVSVTCGNTNVDYTVYIYPITNGAQVEFKNVTLSKA